MNPKTERNYIPTATSWLRLSPRSATNSPTGGGMTARRTGTRRNTIRHGRSRSFGSPSPARRCGPPARFWHTSSASLSPGEAVPVVEVLERFKRPYQRHQNRGERRLAHGFYRASKAIREASGLGYSEPDPILGRCP